MSIAAISSAVSGCYVLANRYKHPETVKYEKQEKSKEDLIIDLNKKFFLNKKIEKELEEFFDDKLQIL